MSLQHERVVELCNELRLGGVAAQYSALAQKAAELLQRAVDAAKSFFNRSPSAEAARHAAPAPSMSI